MSVTGSMNPLVSSSATPMEAGAIGRRSTRSKGITCEEETESESRTFYLHMANINHQKRAAHRRRVQAALQEILNDTGVMPNADCRDLVVSVSRVEFGRTVREIYIHVQGRARLSLDQWPEHPHVKYTRESHERGNEGAFADLTDVFYFRALTDVIARELQKRLGLLYTPVIRRLC